MLGSKREARIFLNLKAVILGPPLQALLIGHDFMKNEKHKMFAKERVTCMSKCIALRCTCSFEGDLKGRNEQLFIARIFTWNRPTLGQSQPRPETLVVQCARANQLRMLQPSTYTVRDVRLDLTRTRQRFKALSCQKSPLVGRPD